ncbi:hypothetical protein [Microcoleus sp. herbarium14]|uniref:hypothetical protein n=1 Tax=Microcoleus sp. herbarium14 TaxID=3055439 RepID=UPI002FD3DAE0
MLFNQEDFKIQQCKSKLSASSPAGTNPKWVESAKKQQKLPFLTLSTAKHWQKNPGIDDLQIGTNALLAILTTNVSKLVCQILSPTDA